MKTSDLRAYRLSAPLPRKQGGGFRNPRGWWRKETLLVRVDTDAGLTGWGESFAHPEVGSVIVSKILKPLLLGQNPLDTEALWERLYFGLGYGGVKGVMVEALSGVDLALWDVRGKHAGKPVSELLAATLGGPPVRQTVDCYATGLYYEPLDDLLAEARGYVEQGFGSIKMKIGLGLDEDLRRVAAVRREVGDDISLKVDANCGFDVATAQELEERLRRFHIDWFEEPIIVEDISGYRLLKESSQVRIAAGEGEYTRWGFRDLLAVVDVAQPDLARCGGLTEATRIVQMAAQRGVPIAPHAFSGAIVLAASLHLAAVAPTFEILEYDRTPNPLREELTRVPFDYRDSKLTVPQGPGLGVQMDEDALARFTVNVS